MSFLSGEAAIKTRRDGIQIIFRFDSEFTPVQRLRVKIEVNTREHFAVLGFAQVPYEVVSRWFNAACSVNTYHLEELLGTKLRALY